MASCFRLTEAGRCYGNVRQAKTAALICQIASTKMSQTGVMGFTIC